MYKRQDNYSHTYLLRNADASNFAAAKTGNDYVELSFQPIEEVTLKGVNLGFWTNGSGDPEFNIGNFKIAIEYSAESSFSNPTLLFEDIQVGNMVAGGYVPLGNSLTDFQLSSTTSHYFRFYLYDEQNNDAHNRVRFDDVQFPVEPLSTCDLDGDGIANEFDLDSDGDGCPDALEGSNSFSLTDIENDTLTGGVDENGVPTVAYGGQSMGGSQDSTAQASACSPGCVNDNDGDLICDAEDLDDDNDGILDTEERTCWEAQIEWTHNGDSGQSESATYTEGSQQYFSNAANAIFGDGLDELTDNYSHTYY